MLIFDFFIRKQEAEWTILTAAKLIAPVIAETFAAGYEWFVNSFPLLKLIILTFSLKKFLMIVMMK